MLDYEKQTASATNQPFTPERLAKVVWQYNRERGERMCSLGRTILKMRVKDWMPRSNGSGQHVAYLQREVLGVSA